MPNQTIDVKLNDEIKIIQFMIEFEWKKEKQEDYIEKQKNLVEAGFPEKSIFQYYSDISRLNDVAYFSKKLKL